MATARIPTKMTGSSLAHSTNPSSPHEPGAGGTAPSLSPHSGRPGSKGGPGSTPAALPDRHHPARRPNFERHNQPVIIFLTLCTYNRQPALATDNMHKLLLEAWRVSRQWRVGQYMIMPDHLHLFCSPAQRDEANVNHWAAYWKGMIARAMQGFGPLAHLVPPHKGGPGSTPAAAATPLWQRDCWDTQLRDASHYGERWQYVSLNPVRKGLTTQPEDWPFQGVMTDLRW